MSRSIEELLQDSRDLCEMSRRVWEDSRLIWKDFRRLLEHTKYIRDRLPPKLNVSTSKGFTEAFRKESIKALKPAETSKAPAPPEKFVVPFSPGIKFTEMATTDHSGALSGANSFQCRRTSIALPR